MTRAFPIDREPSGEPVAPILAHGVLPEDVEGEGLAAPPLRRVAGPAPAEAIEPVVPDFAASPGTFARWLSMPRELQRDALRQYLLYKGAEGFGNGLDRGRLAEFSPYPASDPRTWLFLCGLRTNLAILRVETACQEDAQSVAGQAVWMLIGRVEGEGGNIGLSLKTAAAELGVSQNYLGSAFHRTAGLSFRSFLGGVRVVRAASLLAASPLAVGGIARQLGYSQTSNLLRDFRDTLGTSPSEFRRFMTAASANLSQSAMPDAQVTRRRQVQSLILIIDQRSVSR